MYLIYCIKVLGLPARPFLSLIIMSGGETLVSTALAGLTASLAEAYITYPLEYLKVREQIAIRPLGTEASFRIPHMSSVFYKGSSALAAGNAAKTLIRFRVYNWATKFMTQDSGKHPSSVARAPQIVVAGLLTGIVESMVIVPFESIKTTMIESSALGKGYAVGSLPVPGAPGTKAAQPPSKSSPKKIRPATGTAHPRRIRPQVEIKPKYQLYEVAEYQ